jgi:hypothetical protein
VVVVAQPGERRRVGRSGRAHYQRRPSGRLTETERRAILALAHTKSLRSLAAEFGVSHETVRSIGRGSGGPSIARTGTGELARMR